MKILRGDMIMSNAFLSGQDGGGMSDTKIKKYLNAAKRLMVGILFQSMILLQKESKIS